MTETGIQFSSGYLEYRLNDTKRRITLKPGEDTTWKHGRVAWKVEKLSGGRRVRALYEAEGGVELAAASVSAEYVYPEDAAVFCNGFQSWTTSREYGIHEAIPDIRSLGRLFKLHRYGDYHFIQPLRKGNPLYSHSWTYIRRADSMDFAGSLAEDKGYTILNHNPAGGAFTVTRDCEGVVADRKYCLFDLFLGRGSGDDMFSSYFSLLDLPEGKKTVTGWTSWYNYYTKITEKIILDNLEAFTDRGIPADVFQIDDGYQTAVGDWLSLKDDFPRGMKIIADSISSAGYRPGIWLAPFVCSKNSLVRKEHPEWILTDSRGDEVCAGWNPGWDGPFYTLDIYHEGVRDYLRAVFGTVVNEWGYRVLKLDFLYAAGIIPRLGKSRGKVMAEGVRFLKEISHGADILGCGVPLASCMGVFSYCRIGSDVALKWEDKLLKFLRYRERVSTVNSLESTIGRNRLSGTAFLNDPDVFILRDTVKLNREQRETLFMLNVILGDILFTSDNISEYPPESLDLLRSLYPVRDRRVQGLIVEDNLCNIDVSVGSARYRGYANLGNGSIMVDLPEGRWVRQTTAWSRDETDTLRHFELPSGAFRYFQKIDHRVPCVAGGRGHLFPAAFVESLEMTGSMVSVCFCEDTPEDLEVNILVPEPGTYRVNDRNVDAGEGGSGGGLIRIGRT